MATLTNQQWYKIFHDIKCDKHEHGYHHVYEDVFQEYDTETKDLRILEIGICGGHSLIAWKAAFPNSFITGIDIEQNPERWTHGMWVKKLRAHCKPEAYADIQMIWGFDSTHRGHCSRWRRHIGNPYNVIIDDGDHCVSSQIATFINFFQICKDMYVIEDIIGQQQLYQLTRMIESLGYNYEIHVSHRYDTDEHKAEYGHEVKVYALKIYRNGNTDSK